MKNPPESLVSVPTTEQLMDLEREIHRLVERKRRTDLHIVDLEARIHAAETGFLRETAHFGPIINGLDSYLSAVGGMGTDATRNAGSASRKAREPPKDSDRHLSRTSASYPKALAVHSRLVKEGNLSPIQNSGKPPTDPHHHHRHHNHHHHPSPSRKKSAAPTNAPTDGSGGNSGSNRKRRRARNQDDPAWSTQR